MTLLFRQKTAVYRLFAADDTLLYIGVSNNPDLRCAQHSYVKEWWHQVAKKTVEWFDDRDAALVAERAAIEANVPVHNRQFSPNYSTKIPIPDDGVNTADARKGLSDLISRVRYRGEMVFLYNRGKRVAAVVPVKLAEWIESNVDAVMAAIKAENGED